MPWGDFVAEKTKTCGEFVLGIDPLYADIPDGFKTNVISPTETLERYVNFLIETTADLIGFVKFQSAFFEAFGSKGIGALAQSIASAKSKDLGVILDAKRGDIGSTAQAYANAYLTPGLGSDLEADCLTVNPFLGPDTLEPFFECARKYGKGLFVLTKTSNSGAGWLQDKLIDGTRVSDMVAALVATTEGSKGTSGLSSIGAVVGATFPEDGQRLRKLMPNSIILAPGLGAQGGKPEDIAALRRPDDLGVLVPVSRGATKVKDLSLTQKAYAALIRERIGDFQNRLRPALKP